MFTFSFDYWLYMLPAIALVFIARIWVSSTYRKWGKVPNDSQVTGVEAANRLLTYSELRSVSIEGARGNLSDHYDPRNHKLRLSAAIANERSVASMAVAAHETGHASQHDRGYFPLRVRSALVPIVNIGSTLGWILIFGGLLLRGTLGTQLASIGVAAFAFGTVFALATMNSMPPGEPWIFSRKPDCCAAHRIDVASGLCSRPRLSHTLPRSRRHFSSFSTTSAW